MPHSLANLIVHILFSTKGRRPWLKDPAVRRELYAYMGGILKAIGSTPIEINGVEDHVHLLCTMPRHRAISKIVEEIKSEPSKWLKRKGPAYRGFYWQEGYAAFSVSASQVPKLKRYIRNQAEHHKRLTFQEELRLICQKHGIMIDERHVWG